MAIEMLEPVFMARNHRFLNDPFSCYSLNIPGCEIDSAVVTSFVKKLTVLDLKPYLGIPWEPSLNLCII